MLFLPRPGIPFTNLVIIRHKGAVIRQLQSDRDFPLGPADGAAQAGNDHLRQPHVGQNGVVAALAVHPCHVSAAQADHGVDVGHSPQPRYEAG